MWVQFEKKTWRNLIFTGVNSRRFDLGLSLNNFIVAEVLTSDQPDSLGNEDSNVEAVMMLNKRTGKHFITNTNTSTNTNINTNTNTNARMWGQS